MLLSRTIFILAVFISPLTYANYDSYVVAFSSGFSEENKQTYGISSYETLGQGRWGLYGEMLFSYEGDTFQHCGDECNYVDIKDRQFNFTVGGSYGFTDNLYGLLGAGIRMRGISTSPYNNASACDPEEEPDEDDDASIQPIAQTVTEPDGSQYCSSNKELGVAAQVGLLYVTPFGLSLAGTLDTDKTATLSVGFKF